MRILLLLCLLPCISSAQSWHISAQGGGLWNSKSSNASATEHASPIRGIGGLGLSYQSVAFECGVSVSYRQYAFRREGDIIQFDPFTGQVVNEGHFKFIEKWPSTAIAPFLKYHFPHRKLDYYVGIMPVYLLFDRPGYTDTLTGHGIKYGPIPTGWGADVLVGAAYKLSATIGVFAEGSGGIVNRPSFQERTWVYAASLQIGLRVQVAGKE